MCLYQFLVSLSPSSATSTVGRYLLDSTRDRMMRPKSPRSRPMTSSRGSSSSNLDIRHRALKCVLNVSSSNLSLIGYHNVTTYTCFTHRRSPRALKIHPSSTLSKVPVLLGRISREPLGRFWICKLRWKGIFEGFKQCAIRFVI